MFGAHFGPIQGGVAWPPRYDCVMSEIAVVAHSAAWVDDVVSLFSSRSAVPEISGESCPALRDVVVGTGILSAQVHDLSAFILLALDAADQADRKQPDLLPTALRAGARAALVLDGYRPSAEQVRMLTGSNGEEPKWPTLTARQAWAFANQRMKSERNHLNAGKFSGGSAASGKRYWQLYCDATVAAISDFLLHPTRPGSRHSDLSSSREWRNCEIYQRVQSVSEDRGSYVLRTEFQLVCEDDVILVAQTNDETSADWICSEFPELFDIFTTTVNGVMVLSAGARSLEANSRWVSLSFGRDDSYREEVYRRFPETREFGMNIWRSNRVSVEKPYRLSLSCDFELPLSDPYFYWTAPRRTWLNKLHSDISLLLPHIPGHLWSAPKLARRPTIRIDEQMGIFEIEVKGWVEAGQSIDVRWDGV